MKKLFSKCNMQIISLAFIFIISSCVSLTPITQKTLKIKGLVIRNFSENAIEDVRLRVEATRQFVSCGYLSAGRECSTTFPLKSYQGNSISVLWTMNGKPFEYKNFQVAYGENIDIDRIAMVQITITNNYQVVAQFIQ